MTNRIIRTTLKTKTVKIPVMAGGEFLYQKGQTKSMKMKIVGHEYYLHTLQCDEYDNGHVDECLINSRKIKTVLL